MRKFLSTAILSGIFLAGTANAAVVVTVEAAGVQNTTVSLQTSAVETFDSFSTGYQGTVATFGSGALQGTYTNTTISNANVFGGAGGVGKYNTVSSTSVLDVTGGATNYFGLWATALDGGNTVSFFKDGASVGSVDLTSYLLSSDYRGNPTAAHLGDDQYENFAFFNFFVAGGYDEVKLIENGGGGFENDNQTIGVFTPAPEPASWMMMIAGFGVVGFCLRRPKFAIA
jgi:hypothetical protein